MTRPRESDKSSIIVQQPLSVAYPYNKDIVFVTRWYREIREVPIRGSIKRESIKRESRSCPTYYSPRFVRDIYTLLRITCTYRYEPRKHTWYRCYVPHRFIPLRICLEYLNPSDRDNSTINSISIWQTNEIGDQKDCLNGRLKWYSKYPRYTMI